MMWLEGVDDIVDADAEYNALDEDLTNTSNLSIYNRYVETEVDVEAITFNDAMQVWKKDNIETDCWTHTLYD